ncbi:MAG: DUF418 domain-containing protein [Pseudomonadota bacterium]
MNDTISAATAEDVLSDKEPAVPVRAEQRISSLDFIRGVAVMGILVANILAFGQPFLAYMMPGEFMVPNGDPDGVLWAAQFVVIDGKMRGLFSVLFGAGLYLFMERAWARGAGRWLQFQRLFWLALFGLTHFFFIWRGDILFLYAISGMVALAFVKMKPANQLILGVVVYSFVALAFTGLLGWLYALANMDVGDDPGLAEVQAEMLASQDEQVADSLKEAEFVRSGDYLSLINDTFVEHWWNPLVALLQAGPETIPLMLIGMALYRMGFFSGAFSSRKMVIWGCVGLIVGGAASFAIALWTIADGYSAFGTQWAFFGLSILPRLAMTLGFAALLVELSKRAKGWLGERVSAAGRAAFTNYLGTSIVMLFVFQGWALGLFGELNRPQLYLVTLAMWALMLAWSKPWLDRYRYGPLEWLWRCLTYRKRFPLKR